MIKGEEGTLYVALILYTMLKFVNRKVLIQVVEILRDVVRMFRSYVRSNLSQPPMCLMNQMRWL